MCIEGRLDSPGDWRFEKKWQKWYGYWINRKQTTQEFKQTVKSRVRQFTLLESNQTKDKENSKIRNVFHTNLTRPQEYLVSQVTTLCLQLDGSYKTPILLFYSVNISDSLNSPPNKNLINVHWVTVKAKTTPGANSL